MPEKSLEVENYQNNLKVHYESKQKELNILLTTSMPNQLSNIKTLLWFNVASTALCFKLFESFELIQKGYLVVVSATILILIYTMLVAREKDYGSPEDIGMATSYVEGKWMQAKFFLDMLGTTQNAIQGNRKMVAKRAKLMNLATISTFVSTIYLVILVFLFKS